MLLLRHKHMDKPRQTLSFLKDSVSKKFIPEVRKKLVGLEETVHGIYTHYREQMPGDSPVPIPTNSRFPPNASLFGEASTCSVTEGSYAVLHDSFDEDPHGIFEPPPEICRQRRKSVWAENYDPELDNEKDKSECLVSPKTDAQIDSLKLAIANVFLFKNLDQDQLQQVLNAMYEKSVATGELIIAQGDDGDNFYIIGSGTYEIYVEKNENRELVGHYCDQGSFGELALMYNLPRSATIVAASPGTLWVLDRNNFRRIVLKAAYQKRQDYDRLLRTVPMLAMLTEYELMNVADALQRKLFYDGDCIIRQGDAADGMYFVEDGTVRVTVFGQDNNDLTVTTIGKGGYFGELALVTHQPRSASVQAMGDVKLAFLDVGAFERLLGPCMELMQRNVDPYSKQLAQLKL